MALYLVQHLVDRAAAASPDAIAASEPAGHGLRFAELDRSSARLAHGLARSGVRRHDRVALCLRRTPRFVVAVAGTLRAGAAYVPIDPKWPLERRRQIVEDCRPAALVCDGLTAEGTLRLAQASDPGIPTVCLDERPALAEAVTTPVLTSAELRELPAERPACLSVDADLAYVLYTSGSTGRPKGVMVTHRNVLDYAAWAVDYLGITGADRILATAPFHFDMSTFDVFAALAAGARLCVVPEEHLLFPPRLLDYLEQEGATIWKTVPSLFLYMARVGSLKPGRMPSLERLLFGGETLHPRSLAAWMGLFPEKAFYNVYGPTEATGVSLCHALTSPPREGQARVPIGRPCANTEAFVMRADGRPAGVGEEGELYIRGAGVAAGYWNDPEKTRAAFVPNPLAPGGNERVYRTGDIAVLREDGAFEFLGRADEQVKYMGYRIATTEIEAALVSLCGIDEAAVFLDEAEELVTPELVALVRAEAGRDLTEVGSELRSRLPAYMVPKRILAVESLPRTDRGKLARQELRRLAAGRGQASA